MRSETATNGHAMTYAAQIDDTENATLIFDTAREADDWLDQIAPAGHTYKVYRVNAFERRVKEGMEIMKCDELVTTVSK